MNTPEELSEHLAATLNRRVRGCETVRPICYVPVPEALAVELIETAESCTNPNAARAVNRLALALAEGAVLEVAVATPRQVVCNLVRLDKIPDRLRLIDSGDPIPGTPRARGPESSTCPVRHSSAIPDGE